MSLLLSTLPTTFHFIGQQTWRFRVIKSDLHLKDLRMLSNLRSQLFHEETFSGFKVKKILQLILFELKILNLEFWRHFFWGNLDKIFINPTVGNFNFLAFI